VDLFTPVTKSIVPFFLQTFVAHAIPMMAPIVEKDLAMVFTDRLSFKILMTKQAADPRAKQKSNKFDRST